MSRRLVLLRHGQTDWNAIGRGQGHADVEINDLGHDQAAAVGPVIAAYAPSMLWSSDLARARQTATYVGKECGLEPQLDARFREFDLGERTGLTMAEYAEQFPAEYADFRAGHFTAVPGGETSTEVALRFRAGLDDVVGALAAGETGVVVSHGAALKVATISLLGWPADHASGFQGLDNCGWVVLDELVEGGRFRLAAWNLTATATPATPDFASGPRTG
ncbi:histidine phosphatase family protein [Nocardioides sp. JQ2195]|uniref:histidine phosphatase family protein n=1 Tax=Nocardioides sp. JQ2195 TaxID=2592334 RepID=UPI00143E7789|nr:histidine phosphatase family protein [Nocardioides sp. JQ2195]QIX27379.1 histidine phosphatase family protein [Nocardioides sp. JQ2195]